MTPTGDSFRDLVRSTLDLYARFDCFPTTASSIRNFQEEVRELIEAAQAGADRAHIAEEAADVVVTALGVCFASGLDTESIIRQLYAVMAKNDAKSHDTHIVVEGKIRRRTPK